MSARPRGPQPSGPRAPGPREKTCCWSASSWLHLLRSWSLRSTRGGSTPRLARSRHWDGGVLVAVQKDSEGILAYDTARLWTRPQDGSAGMLSSDLYRQFMADCLRWAKAARNEKDRATYLQLAKTWH